MKTSDVLESSITINGKTITYIDFYVAMEMYGEIEGYSYDDFSINMTWVGILNNSPRPDKGENETEQTVWLPLLREYFPIWHNKNEIKTD